MNTSILSIVELAIGLASLWFLYWEYKAYRIDELRDRLFVIRDTLFKQAAEGKISFDDEAYVMARGMLNGSIRFAHELSLIRLLLISRVMRRRAPRYAQLFRARLNKALGNLSSNEARKIVQKSLADMDVLLVRHVILTSLPLLVLMWIHVLIALVTRKVAAPRAYFRKVKKKNDGKVSAIEAEVARIGGLSSGGDPVFA